MEETKLIVLRGPSGSGKSSAARAVREAQKQQIAIIEQDYWRRIVLKEKDFLDFLEEEIISEKLDLEQIVKQIIVATESNH